MAKVRSPNYPGQDLAAALEMARTVFGKDNRNKVSRAAIAKHLGHESLSGPALAKLGLLRAYGLVDGSGDELRITDDAVTALMAPKGSPEQKSALLRLANEPNLFKEIAKEFAGKPSEDNLRFWLIKRQFSPEAASNAAKSYLGTLQLVGSENGSYNPAANKKDAEIKDKAPPKVGDYVQWTSGGADQFSPPRKVTSISEDGKFAMVHGSLTGVPMSEVMVVETPKVPPAGVVPPLAGDAAVMAAGTGAPKSASSAYAGHDGELNVLLRGQRLEISADVDLAGLERLKEILGKYEEILKLLAPPQN